MKAFHEQQQTFWKMVVKDEKGNVIKTKDVSEYPATFDDNLANDDKDTVFKKINRLFEL